MNTQKHNSIFKPDKQYNRLIIAFGLKQSEQNDRTYFITLSDILRIPIRWLITCIHHGFITESVLQSAQARGINPDFIKHGTFPIWLTKYNYKRSKFHSSYF